MPSQADRSARSRRTILDAAARSFAERGYAGASLNQIITAAGITKGGFYFHFPSKQALALAVLEDQERRWIAQVERAVSVHERAVDRLFAVPVYLAENVAGSEGPADLRKLVEELAADPDLRDAVCRLPLLWIGAVTEQFRAAQEEGTVRRDLDPAELAEVAVGAFHGMQTLTDQFRDGDLPRRIRAVVRVVQQATLTPAEPR
ncbi:MAG: TetR family transcriptional regulator [Nocardioidaceae bacterium]